ncbi:primosomal protein N' [Neisseriaceae bacterium ESL0693]|nr:primosomal protein N' [Neisseriaceae bacterium ESL0693]
MIYHHIALNVPLYTLFTYAHPKALAEGTRVAIRFRGKRVCGVVWQSHIQPDIDVAKIQPIETVFDDGGILSASWRQLLTFTAHYYHYPLGQAVMAALPRGLREAKAMTLPSLPLAYQLSAQGQAHEPPATRFYKQRALWDRLSQTAATLDELRILHPQARQYLQKWQQQGWISQHTLEPHAAPTLARHSLNPEQQLASNCIQQHLNQFTPFLLHGITGSGKTEVYFDVMEKVLQQGQQVLFLLPEINLTPQLLQRVQQRFAHTTTAVLHSQTAAGERTQNYLRAALNQAALVIGTRLAVFTPLPRLGLIVVDEEHDPSFKQDSELRYQARDLAIWRARQAQCPIILGSATPSLESWHKAQQQQYQLLTLQQRAHTRARLPDIHLVDTRRLPLDNGFSEPIKQQLQANFAAGGMSMVYLNRRGFAPALFCSACGHTFGCPHCSAKMVLHQRAAQLRCHHCDYRLAVPAACPECGNQDLSAVGHGTQRVEETLHQLLPQARILRVDRDSTSHKQDWIQIYQQIEAQQVDILVGTQMLAKGHDFGRLNLVVVVNADGSLYSADFRAPERLFAELMQVAGRCGRAEHQGHVWVQTMQPENPVFQALKTQHYADFANHELQQRQLMHMPPFQHMAAIRADARTMAQAQQLLRAVQQQIDEHQQHTDQVSIFGPVPMLMARLAGHERAQIFLESHDRRALHQALSVWQSWLIYMQNDQPHTRWLIDVDPLEM